MTRRRVVAFIGMLVLGVTLTACGDNTEDSTSDAASAPIENPVDPATAGAITGRVAFEGTVAPPQPIRMNSDPNCISDTSVTRETLVVGGAGGLSNVFVYVKDGLGDLRFPVPSTPVVLDQRGCRYTPHVFGVRVGQPIEVLNSDDTLHNVHAIPESNREFNVGQPIRGMKHTHSFSTAEVMVLFKCDVHSWMTAYAGVLTHPFFAVTAGDGSFTLDGLPPGTYTIEAWHEQLGTMTQTVTIGDHETVEAEFSFAG